MRTLLFALYLLAITSKAQVPGTDEPSAMYAQYKYTPAIYRQTLADATLKSYADDQADVMAVVPKGELVKITARDHGFYRVIYDNTAGFVHFSFIDSDYKAFKADKFPHGTQTTIDYENEPDSLIIYGKVKVDSPLKEEPALSSLTTYLIPAAAVVKITTYNERYWRAEIDGHVGYLPKPYVYLTGKTPDDLNSEFKPKRASGVFGVLKEVQTQNRTHRSMRASSTPYYIRGPRGGCYYITGSGRKEYVDISLCN